MKNTEKSKKKSVSSILLCLIGLALIGIALALLIPNLLDYKKSNDTYENLQEAYVTEDSKTEDVIEDENSEEDGIM